MIVANDKVKGTRRKCMICEKWFYRKGEKYSIMMYGKCILCKNKKI